MTKKKQEREQNNVKPAASERVASLPNHTETSKDEKCKICLVDTATYALIPCGHLCMCQSCCCDSGQFVRGTPCIICRKPIDGFLQIYK